MISMDLLDNWIIQHIAWWAPYGLMLCVPILLAWFPGANARLRGHDLPRAVSALSWLLTLSTGGLALYSNYSNSEPLALVPVFIMLWTGIVVWSYGKRELQPVTECGRGFEIIFPRPLCLTLEVAAAAE